MANIFEILREGKRRQNTFAEQRMTQGVVASVSQGMYKVVAGQIEYLAQCGINEALKPGDRVWVVLGRGTPRIIGLMGKDENA